MIKKGVGRKIVKNFFINNFSPINSFFKVNNQSGHTKLKKERILNFLYSENINSTEKEVEIITLKKLLFK